MNPNEYKLYRNWCKTKCQFKISKNKKEKCYLKHCIYIDENNGIQLNIYKQLIPVKPKKYFRPDKGEFSLD